MQPHSFLCNWAFLCKARLSPLPNKSSLPKKSIGCPGSLVGGYSCQRQSFRLALAFFMRQLPYSLL